MPPFRVFALAMAGKRGRGRPRKTLLTAKPRDWKKGKKRPRKEARPGRPGLYKMAHALTSHLLLQLVENRLKGAPTWKAALEQIPFTPGLSAEILLRRVWAARRDPRVQTVVLAKHPSARGLLFAPI
jgi:hypothetical protein